jgi:phosphopantothenoylcysteine decarboxylase/phosphopantothenate--cysteine ligase
MANDLLTTLCLATAAPIAIAPAMNQLMWAKAATQANVATLRERGIAVLGPASGSQACGEFGAGRLLEAENIVAELVKLQGPRSLAGKRVLVSAGPTFEDIDPVRFIGNRSSGRMGFAIADAAAVEGADVTLIAGPVSLETPRGVERVDVRSAREMRDAVLARAGSSDVFISAAAVGDFRPEAESPQKIKKHGGDSLDLKLVQNPDILAEVAALSKRPFVVGFAAETEKVEQHARTKLEKKRVDLIAANEVGAGRGFEASDNALLLIWNGGSESLDRADKRELAARLVARVVERMRAAERC